jgi:hypothetical protein
MAASATADNPEPSTTLDVGASVLVRSGIGPAPGMPSGNGDGNGGGCRPGTTVNATLSADPTGEVALGATIHLTGTADAVHWLPDCSRHVQHLNTGTWSLSFARPGGVATDITGQLSAGTGLTTTFVAANEGGTYLATFAAEVGLNSGFAQAAITVPPRVGNGGDGGMAAMAVRDGPAIGRGVMP